MAYNKSKGKQKHGDVIYEGDADTQIDFEQNEIKFRTGGTIRGSFTNGGLSVTGSYITAGAISASLGITGSSFECDREVVAGTLTANASNQAGIISGSGTATLFGLNVGQGAFTVSNEGLLSSSTTPTLVGLNVGQGTLTVSNQGLLSSSATPTLVGLNVGQGMFTVANNGLVSASATPTLTGLDIGEGAFTVGKEGAIKSSGSLNVSGHTSLGITGSLVPLHVNGSTQQILITSQLNSVVAGTSIAQINFGSSVLSSNFYTGAKIEALGDCTWDLANNSSPTRLTLSTVPSGSATARSRLAINSSGTVGIGDNFYPTTNALLHVSASTQEHNLYVAAGKVGINTATLTNELTVVGVISGSSVATLFGLDVGQSAFTVTNQGLLSSSATPTLVGLNVGQGVFTVSNEGAVVGTSLNNSSGGITNAGSIAGATTMSASSNVNVGGTLNAANSGFMVDADGDTTVKSLTAAAGDVKGIVISGSSTATLYGLNIGQGVMTVSAEGATATKNLTATGVISGSSTATLYGLNVGQGTLTVSNQGLLSSSTTPTLVGLNVGQGAFTMDKEGVVNQLVSIGEISGSGHGVFDTVSIGKDVSSAADRGALHIEAQHDELVFLARSATHSLIMGITGSGAGQVTVGGAHLDAKFNVTGSDIDKLISLKSDTVNPAFYVSGSGDLFISGNVGIATPSPTAPLDVNGNAIRIRTANTPANASALGAPGEIRWDSNYIYICVATDTWKRVAIGTW